MEHITHNMEYGARSTNIGKNRPITLYKQGFALMFAILASSVLMSVALAIVNLALRQVALSSFGRDSQIAFFAADSGVECAFYWDLKRNAVATSSIDASSSVKQRIRCGEGAGGEDERDFTSNPSSATTKFIFDFDGNCTEIVFTKNDSDNDGFSKTKLESKGHNTACSDTTSPLRLERALRVIYGDDEP